MTKKKRDFGVGDFGGMLAMIVISVFVLFEMGGSIMYTGPPRFSVTPLDAVLMLTAFLLVVLVFGLWFWKTRTIVAHMPAHKGKHEYIYADDPIVGKRVVHAVVNGWAISMVTGHKFRFKRVEMKKKMTRKENIINVLGVALCCFAIFIGSLITFGGP